MAHRIATLTLLVLLVSTPLAKASSPEQSTREEIRSTIGLHVAEIRGCYENALSNKPALNGKVVVAFKIDETGSVVDPKINEKTSTLNDTEVQTCVLNHLKKWGFPHAEKGKLNSVNYPFTFASGKAVEK